MWIPKKPYLILPGDKKYLPPGSCHIFGDDMMGAASGPVSASAFLDPSGGTPIGDMTDAGGLASAFDGTLHQGWASSAETAGGDSGQSYLGIDWGVGNEKTITSINIYGPNNTSLHNSSTTHDIFLDIIGHTSNAPGSATLLSDHTAVSNVPNDFDMEEITVATDLSTAYRYTWCDLNSVFTGAQFAVSELEFYGY